MTAKKQQVFETIFRTYTEVGVIGEGGSGRVYKVTDEVGQVFAIKLLDASKATGDKRKRFQNELTFGKRNTHKNLITILDDGFISEAKTKAPFYVMPCYGKSLRTLMAAGIPAKDVLVYFSQLLDGVEAAHLQRVIHRDIKPENVLYESGSNMLLLADFGIAHFEEEDLFTAVETKAVARLANFQYAAPEQRSRGLTVDSKADIFALGLILNEMFTREIPQGTSYKTIASIAPEYAYLDDLVHEMIKQASASRPAVEQIKQQLLLRRNDFISRQRLSEITKHVVPVSEIDDPIVKDPPRLIAADYAKGHLILVLSREVNDNWITALQRMHGWTSVAGKPPERFQFDGQQAYIDAEEHEVQQIVNHFKDWLPVATREYERRLKAEKDAAARRLQEKLDRERAELERRERVLKNLKI